MFKNVVQANAEEVFNMNSVNAHHERSKEVNPNHYAQHATLLNLHDLLMNNNLDFSIALKPKDFSQGKGIKGVVISKKGVVPNMETDFIDMVDAEGGCYKGKYLNWEEMVGSYVRDNP